MRKNADHYRIVLFYSDEDDGWIADIPELPYCSAFGETPQEAVTEVLVARDLWLDAAHDADRPIPEPAQQPAETFAGTR